MRFRYIGDQPATRTMRHEFPRGEAVEVTDAGAVSRLKGNSHFEVVTGRPPKGRVDGDES